MSNSPTPRTDALIQTRVNYTSVAAWSKALHEHAEQLEREVAELRAAGDAVVPFLVAEKPIDYVADGEAWNKRAAFLSLHQAAYHKFREEWVARKKMNQPPAQGGSV